MRNFAGLGCFIACALLSACSEKQTPVAAATDGGEVVTLAAHDISQPLREMVKMPQVAPEHDADEYEPVRMIPHPHMRAVPKPDPVVQSTMGLAPAIPTLANFEGQGAGMPGFQPGGVPPDTDGDIGPNHYVQVVNTSLTIFSRTGTVMMGPSPTGSVFTGFAGACGQSNDGDATVRYDHLADRWVVAQFSIGNGANGPYYQCVAVSTSPDPTGTYARYQYNYTALNDYPKVGLWPDGYYFTFNMFGNSFEGGKVCAMDRVKMLAGDATATMQCFDAGVNYGGLLASDVDGHTPPPAGAPNYVIALDQDTGHAFWKLHVDFTTPANSTFTGPTPITTASYSLICNGGGSCITQPTGGAQLASLGDRAMNRFVYRRFADHESLLLTHTVGSPSGTGSGIRWYEIRNPSTTPTVFQQGTYAPDNAFRWIPSIAMDGTGNIAVVYSVSSSTIKPSIRIAAHAVTDPAGMFGAAESPVVDGAGVQTSIDRWGDYAALNIDPVDDCTFWATQEYHGMGNGQGNWRTRIASFILPNCGSFALPNVTDETVAQKGTASYPIATMTSAGAAQTVTLDTTGLPAGVTATFSPASVQSGTSAMITLAADETAPLGLAHYTITATSPTSFATVDVALTVTAPQAPDAGNGNGSDGNGGQSGGCCESSKGSSPYGSMLIAGLVLGIGLRRRRRA